MINHVHLYKLKWLRSLTLHKHIGEWMENLKLITRSYKDTTCECLQTRPYSQIIPAVLGIKKTDE